MRRIVAALVALLICQAIALADLDLSAMSVDELRQLRDAVNLELAARCQDDGALASWLVPDGRIDLLAIKSGLDDGGNTAYSLHFAFTNLTDETVTFSHDTAVFIYQGSECEWAFVNGSTSLDRMKRVLPGGTNSTIIYGFLPNDDSGFVDVEVCAIARYSYPSAGIITLKLPD